MPQVTSMSHTLHAAEQTPEQSGEFCARPDIIAAARLGMRKQIRHEGDELRAPQPHPESSRAGMGGEFLVTEADFALAGPGSEGAAAGGCRATAR